MTLTLVRGGIELDLVDVLPPIRQRPSDVREPLPLERTPDLDRIAAEAAAIGFRVEEVVPFLLEAEVLVYELEAIGVARSYVEALIDDAAADIQVCLALPPHEAAYVRFLSSPSRDGGTGSTNSSLIVVGMPRRLAAHALDPSSWIPNLARRSVRQAVQWERAAVIAAHTMAAWGFRVAVSDATARETSEAPQRAETVQAMHPCSTGCSQ